MKVKNIVITLLLFFHFGLSAQSSFEATLDQFIKDRLEQFSEIPGISVTVIRKGESSFIRSYGWADTDRQVPATPSSAYYIASATKSFVGLLAAQLAEEGLFKLDDPITSFAPIKDFKDKRLFEGVTIQDLLSHTSGITNGPLTWRFASEGSHTRADLVRILEEETQSLYSKRFRYSNFGYNLFDVILWEEFGKDWKDLLQKKIFGPLGMTRTTAHLSHAEKNEWVIAKAYTAFNNERSPQPTLTQKNEATFQAAGGMVASVADLEQWLLLHMNQGKVKGEQVIAAEVIAKAHTKLADNRGRGVFADTGYGLGWNKAVFNKKAVEYHLGVFEGNSAHLSYLPEEGIGIAILINESEFGDNLAYLIAGFAYDLMLGEVKAASEYDQKTAQVAQRIDRIQQALAADRARRADREWKLSKPMVQYAGSYTNAAMGTLEVKLINGQPMLSIGVSKSEGTPSNIKDAMRVEFRRARAADILFIYKGKKVVAAVHDDYVYYKR